MKHSSVETIQLIGAATHNLKGIDVDFPLRKISVVSGRSGSGKSSLVFDTLYAESYLRYVESLSTYARQFIKALPKPQVKEIRHLPPGIAVKQGRSRASSRSTVGTMTEITDLLRLIFTHLSKVNCHECGCEVKVETQGSIAESVAISDPDEVFLLASLKRFRAMKSKDLRDYLLAQGFLRIMNGEGVARIEACAAKSLHLAYVVVDRIKNPKKSHIRLIEALNLGLKLGGGVVFVQEDGNGARCDLQKFSSRFECDQCHIAYEEPQPMLFSFNHPLGACGKCQGFGLEPQLDKNKMIPDLKSSVSDFGVAPWNFGKHRRYYTQARQSAKLRGFDIATPFASYDDDDWRWLFSGDGKKFKGIEGYFAYLDRKKYKVHYRIHGARFKNYVRCASCQGHRLNPLALACRIDDRNIGQLMDLSLDLLNSWVAKIIDRKNTEKKIVTNRDLAGAEDALLELKTRLAYLNKIGLSYLNLNRTVRSLSGGEFQRINMTRCLGSALVDTLYCLDEPTCGLHPKDTASLISVIAELKSQGNTVVIVEHDKSVIKAADYLVEIGPGAGHLGGNLTFKGDPKTHVIGRSLRDAGSATLVTPSGSSVEHHTDCTKLKAALALGVPNGEQALARISPLKGEAAEITEGEPTEFFSIESVSTNNLKNVSCRFPVAALTVVCGVSGSGKTSLIQHTLLPRLQSLLGQPVDEHLDVQSRGGTLRHESLIKYHESAELVSQGAIGRSSRSNIATYLDLMTEIRKIFAKQNDAKAMGLKAGDFSFNTPGGRCEECCGMGTVVEDLSFLGEMEVICQSCEGKRFTDNVLKIDVQGKNLTDVLGMTVAEARQFFFENKKIRETADATMDIGLDYLTLGQHTSSFSGGEAQRLKLLGTLRKLRDGHRKILIFDEPSSGLSDKDIALLLGIFRKLVSEHHTVIVIEHHLDVIKACDWVVEVGPMAAEKGGEIIFQGPLQSFRQQSSSPTAPYL